MVSNDGPLCFLFFSIEENIIGIMNTAFYCMSLDLVFETLDIRLQKGEFLHRLNQHRFLKGEKIMLLEKKKI